jgi:hypothetical protein
MAPSALQGNILKYMQHTPSLAPKYLTGCMFIAAPLFSIKTTKKAAATNC